ncbi:MULTISPECIES: DUF2922 domain-containing protein [Pediococcus]|jgi:hypothetical protein|uniref:DUF2922 family protein n=1 Tax=Pediococcus parvulus TaxID=54062 RepID=A0A176TJS5_9LACO|nr:MULTISPECIES: DUF2922 domain-containing protein [Pediococcus]MCT3027658.1 DUF2922 domain-containing protein [Pediococcus parvulus]MCT3028225.1 DUF2922 domain-containing protein [Pediococcus parvulus]MCT3031145.1 DUF2922 domain-containing protein [Pediococcus parvulus]MCT3035337.1 DUF2922 domain-containing protein [Pediococcus parvulus]MDN5575435.1 DUF2922 domain-containing protein [Pediococcus sp.]
MKQLDMEFVSSLGKVRHIKLKYVNEGLEAPAVKTAMTQLAGLKLFVKDDEELYAKPQAAKYIETIDTPLFDDDAIKA